MAERTISRTRPMPPDRAGRRVSFLEVITAVAIVAALLAVGERATGQLPSERAAATPDRPTRLIQMDRTWDGTQVRWQGLLRVLDPATGAETGQTLPLHLPEGGGGPVFSADGRTVAYTDRQPPLTPPGVQQPASIATVADIASGSVLRTLTFSEPTFVMRLNADGSRVILYQFSTPSHPPFILLTVAVATGATISRVTLPSSSDEWPALTPDLRTAYVLDTHDSGTWPNVTSGAVTLDLIDTATGARRIVPLPMVHAGVSPEGRTVHGQPVIRSLAPALVVSPDSARLSIIHPDADALTIVNMKEARVERNESLHPTRSAVARLVGWLAPARIAAKEAPESTSKQAVISPDGRTLAVTGTAVHPRDDGSYDVTDQGILFVDLQTLAATGHVLQRQYQGDARPLTVQWSADSQRLYIGGATGAATSDGSADAYQIQVMDARTQRITATQTYTTDTDATRYLRDTWFALPQ